MHLVIARNEVGARLCFYMCLWFCPQLVAAAETRTVGKRTVRILLECFLVTDCKQTSVYSKETSVHCNQTGCKQVFIVTELVVSVYVPIFRGAIPVPTALLVITNHHISTRSILYDLCPFVKYFLYHHIVYCLSTDQVVDKTWDNIMVPTFPDWQNSLTFPVFLPARNSSCGKVIFSQASAKNSVHGWRGIECLPKGMLGYTHPMGADPQLGRHPPPHSSKRYGQQAGSTHSTGMLSCSSIF